MGGRRGLEEEAPKMLERIPCLDEVRGGLASVGVAVVPAARDVGWGTDSGLASNVEGGSVGGAACLADGEIAGGVVRGEARGTVRGTVRGAVCGAAYGVVCGTVREAAYGAVRRAVRLAVG